MTVRPVDHRLCVDERPWHDAARQYAEQPNTADEGPDIRLQAERRRSQMPSENGDRGDVFGLRPYGEAAKILTQGAVDAAAAFLGRICLPAAEEFGHLLKDKVAAWRAANAISIARRAEALLMESAEIGNVHAHPRLVLAAIEHGSWADEPDVQHMWAGLLASSCTTTGDDQSNLLFMNTLSQMTPAQAKIVDYSCENSTKTTTKAGLIWSNPLREPAERLMNISGIGDIHQLDRELDYLRRLDLIQFGISAHDQCTADELRPDVTPSAFALHLHVRCQGSRDSPVKYYGVGGPT